MPIIVLKRSHWKSHMVVSVSTNLDNLANVNNIDHSISEHEGEHCSAPFAKSACFFLSGSA